MTKRILVLGSTVLDLGQEGAVYTEGRDRWIVTKGDEAKATKAVISTQRIYPPATGHRSDLFGAAAPVIQQPPAYGAVSPTSSDTHGHW